MASKAKQDKIRRVWKKELAVLVLVSGFQQLVELKLREKENDDYGSKLANDVLFSVVFGDLGTFLQLRLWSAFADVKQVV